MEQLTRNEMKIFNLIKQGKTREDILNAKVTTQANLSFILSGIYKKTENIVNYHTAKNKYEELACYLRNNPDEFSIIPSPKAPDPKPEPHQNECKETTGNTKISTAEIFRGLCGYLNSKYNDELEKINIKKSVVDDIETYAKDKLLLKF